jgi:hypothetical protein
VDYVSDRFLWLYTRPGGTIRGKWRGRLRVTTRNMEIHDISSVMLQAGVTDVSYL